jgi:(5-formylfuran-3-yl)methyl phosphate synthase
MQLLVSVATAAEVPAALEGGADLIDAKNPATGSLGAVSVDELRAIRRSVAAARPVTAALGDATDPNAIERAARAAAMAGAAFVKLGFAGISGRRRVARLIRAAVCGATAGTGQPCCVVAVAYADADRATTVTSTALVEIAADAGAAGLLLDTVDKRGPGVCVLKHPDVLAAWVGLSHNHGLFAAVAGKLSAEDLPVVLECGADIAGVRGAACEGGRTGGVSAKRVRLLRVACDSAAAVRSARLYSDRVPVAGGAKTEPIPSMSSAATTTGVT